MCQPPDAAGADLGHRLGEDTDKQPAQIGPGSEFDKVLELAETRNDEQKTKQQQYAGNPHPHSSAPKAGVLALDFFKDRGFIDLLAPSFSGLPIVAQPGRACSLVSSVTNQNSRRNGLNLARQTTPVKPGAANRQDRLPPMLTRRHVGLDYPGLGVFGALGGRSTPAMRLW